MASPIMGLDRPAVQDVFVEINEMVGDDEDPQTWPFSDRIYMLTSARREDVKEWVAKLQPDEVEEGWANGVRHMASPKSHWTPGSSIRISGG